jgi:hypothetical protein
MLNIQFQTRCQTWLLSPNQTCMLLWGELPIWRDMILTWDPWWPSVAWSSRPSCNTSAHIVTMWFSRRDYESLDHFLYQEISFSLSPSYLPMPGNPIGPCNPSVSSFIRSRIWSGIKRGTEYQYVNCIVSSSHSLSLGLSLSSLSL